MNLLSNRILALAESQSFVMAQRCAQMRAQGIDVVGFTLGEPDFDTPMHIKEAAKQAVDNNLSHYGPIPGIMSLRTAICHKLQKENNMSYTENEILVCVGAKQAICNVVLAVVNPGDEVVVPTPCWVSYSEMVKLAEGTNVFVRTTAETDFKLTPEQLRGALTERSKLIFLCSPNNPTGSVYSQEELEALAEVLRDYPQVVIISDEIYEHINYVGRHSSIAALPGMADRTVIINGVSKAYAMTGYRIGWMACKNHQIVDACKKLQGQYLTHACMVAQKAAEAAYTGSQECVAEMCYEFMQLRDLVMQFLRLIPGISCVRPEGAFYAFPDVTSYYGCRYGDKVIQNSADMADYLLDVAHVACVAGSAFGEDTCIRLSFATDRKTITEGLTRIREALKKLKE